MAPKRQANADDATAKKNEMATMVTVFKKSKLESHQNVLKLYQSLDRFSAEKTAILQAYKKDKKCAWYQDFVQTRTATVQKTSAAVEGFATKSKS